MTEEETKEEEWDYYIVHDSIGVSHVFRTKKGQHPGIRCIGCED